MTKYLELYIIELPKFNKYKGEAAEALNLWVEFIKDPGVINMGEATEGIKKAKEVLVGISQDEYERNLAESREKYRLEMASSESYGFDRGLEEGEKKGKKEGKKEEKLAIAKKMKDKNIPIEQISEITGLSIEEIEKI